jgi:hypothetical protein
MLLSAVGLEPARVAYSSPMPAPFSPPDVFAPALPEPGVISKIWHSSPASAVREYVVNKAKDVATFAVLTAVHPLSLPQNLLALTISLGSTGTRIPGRFGFAIYENSQGLSRLFGKALQDPYAFAPGFAAFAFGPVDRDTFVHEHQHYLQSLITGPLYLPGLAFEAIRAARQCGANSECIHRVSVFEKDAALAEKVGLHFPFIDASGTPAPSTLPPPPNGKRPMKAPH